MIPELFELPIVHVTLKSYGLMMVIGFLMAAILMRRMAKRIGENPESITNIALYALILGVVGARIFYVIHHIDRFQGDWKSVFAVWEGGLEFIGGVILGTAVMFTYMYVKRLSILKNLDILVVGLMLGLSFGRVGCLLNGCCFGKPTESVCSIQFPYGSAAYLSQVFPDKARNRDKPLMELPDEYYGYISADGVWITASAGRKYDAYLKPYEMLTDEQKQEVKGKYAALPVHPSQLYSSANALLLCGVLYLFWRRFALTRPGLTLGMMCVLYGTSRFLLELTRDDNPFEQSWWTIYKGGTISQNIGIYMVLGGVIFLVVLQLTGIGRGESGKSI